MKQLCWSVITAYAACLALASYLFLLYSQPIIPIESFREVNFDAIRPGTLVIFDVDETLIQPRDALVAHMHSEQVALFVQSLMQKHPDLDFNYLNSLILTQAEIPLIEPGIAHVIDTLKQRGVLVIACTNMNTGGPYGILPTLEQWRYEHLLSLGFQGSYGDTILTFTMEGRHPVFYKGILAADLIPKGTVISAFLDETELHPSKILMFDDSLEYLQSVQTACQKREIPFQGYQYRGALKKPWDEALANTQADYLIKHERWLSDAQAQAMP